MKSSSKELSQTYIHARRRNPAWQLLAARRAPLILGCLKSLFEKEQDNISLEDALQFLAEAMMQFANNAEFGIETDDFNIAAHKELRNWIRKGLVVEREGRLFATDALQITLNFVDHLESQSRIMTSTASRLAIVQREIENLELRLNPDPKSRTAHLKRKIQQLEQELDQVKSGKFEVLEGAAAVEGIREIYNLASSLRADFRRVEDSYREADRNLRESIIKEHHHRGEIVDKLLDDHELLLETPEGQVFHNFYEQLTQSTELENMRLRLRTILDNPISSKALDRRQRSDLRILDTHLVGESLGVIRARARTERDVKGFLKTGLAAENHRVGELLMNIMEAAYEIDWSSRNVQKAPSNLPPIAIAIANLSLVERLRFKSVDTEEHQPLQLEEQIMNLDDVKQDFWESFDDLDRGALIKKTIAFLKSTGDAKGLAQLANELLSHHDLEELALWIEVAREAEIPVSDEKEYFEMNVQTGKRVRYHVPKVRMRADDLKAVDEDIF